MSTYYTIEDGKIANIMEVSGEVLVGPEWKEAPGDWGGKPLDKVEWFDKNMRRLPIPAKDLGKWYNTKNREVITITEKSDPVDKELFTKEIPPESSPFIIWDKTKGKWEIDKEAKAQAEKEEKMGQKSEEVAIILAEISSRDYRALKAIKLGKDVEELYPGERAWYKAKIEELHEIEEEIERLSPPTDKEP